MRISPSQIAAHRSCARRYAWEYGHGLRSPSTPSQEKGTAIHALLEDYLNGKGPIDATTELGAIAQAGLPYLPAPLSGKAEQEFTIAPASKLPFSFFGKIDYVTPTLVLDHKTTSDFKYVKTEAVLREDPQVILYASAGFKEHPEYQGDVRYVYYLTAKRKVAQARKLDLNVSREHVSEKFEAISRDAETLYQIRLNKTEPLTLPPSLDHCNQYGGCPHKNRCTDLHTPEDVLRRIMLPGKDDLLGQLMAAAGLPAPAVKTETLVALEPTPVEVPVVAEVKPELAKDETPAPAETKPKAKKEKKEEPKRIEGVHPIVNLFVDCLPLGVQVVGFEQTVAPKIREKLQAVTEVAHYKMIDYGKGTGIWSEAVREYCLANLTAVDLSVDSRSTEGADALGALQGLAKFVIRGIR